jgi:hypothetical protein
MIRQQELMNSILFKVKSTSGKNCFSACLTFLKDVRVVEVSGSTTTDIVSALSLLQCTGDISLQQWKKL